MYRRCIVVVSLADRLHGLHGSESLKTRPGSMSESPALESYVIFREFV